MDNGVMPGQISLFGEVNNSFSDVQKNKWLQVQHDEYASIIMRMCPDNMEREMALETLYNVLSYATRSVHRGE